MDDTHTVHEIDIRALGKADFGALHPIGGVGHDIERAREAEVLRIVGREVHLDATVVGHPKRINDEIAVEGYRAIGCQGAEKVVVHQIDAVLVNIDVGEHVLEHRVEDVARTQQLVDALRLLANDDALLRLGRAAINIAHHALFDRDGEDARARFVASFNVVLEERHAFEFVLLEDLGRDVVEGESHLAILVDGAEVVAIADVAAVLGCDNTAHQLHRRIVLARIAAVLLARDDGLVHLGVKGFKGNVVRASLFRAQCLALVANHTETQFSIGLKAQFVVAILVRLREAAALVTDNHEWQSLARLGINDAPRHGLGCCAHHKEGKDEKGIYTCSHLVYRKNFRLQN